MEFSITTDMASSRDDVVPLLDVFAEAGFKAVHWCHHWAGTPVFYDKAFAESILRSASARGLRIADVHGYSGPDEGTTYTDELFLAANVNRLEFARRIGADVLVVHLPLRGRGDYRTDDKCRTQAAVDHSSAMLEALRKPAAEYAVRVALENLGPPACAAEFFDPLFERFGGDFLGFCYDSGHALMYNCVGLIERYAGRLIATHLHDNDGSGDQHRPPGHGKVDWAYVVRALRQSGYGRAPNLELIKPKEAPLREYCFRAFEIVSKLFEPGP